MNNKMYTVEISNVCSETVYCSQPKKALQKVIKERKLPFSVTNSKDITNSNQVGAKVSLLGGQKESITYYIIERQFV